LARNNKTVAGRLEENRRMDDLILRATAKADWYDALCDGEVVGCIHLRPIAAPGHGCGRWPGFAETLEAAMTAFAKSWRREG